MCFLVADSLAFAGDALDVNGARFDRASLSNTRCNARCNAW